MHNRARNFLVALIVVALICLVPWAVGRAVLHVHAERVGRIEVEAMAERELERAETAVAEAITTLRSADRAGLADCTADHLARYADLGAHTRFLRRVGVADGDGRAMCFDPPTPRRRGAPLFDASAKRQVTIAAVDPEVVPDTGVGTVWVAWRTSTDLHLVAELGVGVLDRDAGAEYLRGARALTVLIGEDTPWLSVGARVAEGDAIATQVRSDHFPLSVRAEVSRAAVLELIRPLEATLTIGAIAVATVLAGIAFLLFWKPTSEVDDEISVALKREEFVPYFQPVMNIDTGRIEGCEMLVRWIRADGTMVSPGAFMSYCETSGHVFEMTRLLMRKSVEQLGDLYGRHRELKLSINLFAGHFDDRRIVEDVLAIFEGSRIGLDQLVFEVTERYPLRDVVQARRIISEMHALGCRVALDDTGTGHGGLAYIQQLGIDIVKIDKMFVDAMSNDLGASTIVDVLVELANSLGMGVVAEGVETQDQLERLREKGVTSAQGYVFAPALPAKLFIDLAEGMLGRRRAVATEAAEAA